MTSSFGVVEFKTREMMPEDVPACARLGAEKTPHERMDPSLVCQLWPKLLKSRRMKAAVVEDNRHRIIAFGASTFLTRDFAQQLQLLPLPFISKQVIEAETTQSPKICAIDEIATANATSGLTVFILHSGLSDATDNAEQVYVAKAQLLTAFFELHRGYNINNFMAEPFGAEELAVYLDTGLQRASGYSSADYVLPGSPQPHLLCLSRADALQLTTTALLPLFLYRKPRFRFNSSEQNLLLEALQGRTDEDLAARLHLALSTVKKQWARVFEKAEVFVPELRSPKPIQQSSRGPQRRHALLRILRDHPEELTPFKWSVAASASA
jgi:DNA-binding CsgD family transcriptional regulator